jgi:hypothetical protein
MSKKLTPWFESHTYPAYNGVYETRYKNINQEWTKGYSKYFDGDWYRQQYTVDMALDEMAKSGFSFRKVWRGIHKVDPVKSKRFLLAQAAIYEARSTVMMRPEFCKDYLLNKVFDKIDPNKILKKSK